MNIMAGNMAANRHGSGAVAKSLHVKTMREMGEEGEREGEVEESLEWLFEISQPSPSDTYLPVASYPLIFPNSSTNWGPSI